MSLVVRSNDLPAIAQAGPRDAPPDPGHDPRRLPFIAGLVLIFGIFGSMAVWAYFSQVDRGVRANGVVTIATPRQVVNSATLGTVREIFVKENDFVAQGQVLLSFESAEVEERLALVHLQLYGNLVRQRRYAAEYAFEQRLDLSGIPAFSLSPRVAGDIRDEQQQLFEAGLDRFQRERAVSEAQIVQVRNMIEGLSAQKNSVENQMALIADEMLGMEELLAKGYIAKARFLSLKRASEALNGNLGQIEGQLSLRGSQILELEKTLDQLRSTRRAAALERLDLLRAEEDTLRFQIIAFEERLDEKVIASPHDGYVLDLGVNNPGYVVSPGQAIMQIVPQDDEVTIEAKVSTADISGIEEDMPAEVRISTAGGAKAARRAPLLHGYVDSLSADVLSDPRTGLEYYLARVKVPGPEWSKLNETALPGMRADILFRAGSRNVLDFLISPLSFVFERGLTAR